MSPWTFFFFIPSLHFKPSNFINLGKQWTKNNTFSLYGQNFLHNCCFVASIVWNQTTLFLSVEKLLVPNLRIAFIQTLLALQEDLLVPDITKWCSKLIATGKVPGLEYLFENPPGLHLHFCGTVGVNIPMACWRLSSWSCELSSLWKTKNLVHSTSGVTEIIFIYFEWIMFVGILQRCATLQRRSSLV